MTQFAAATPDDLFPRDDLLALDGMAIMRAMQDGRMALPAMVGLMNGWLQGVAPGEVAFRARPEFSHTNTMGTVHGGWYAALLDTALGCAVRTAYPAGCNYTTLELKVNIIRPVPLGTEVEAVGRVQHAGRSTAVAAGEMRGVEDGVLHATGSTTCIVLRG